VVAAVQDDLLRIGLYTPAEAALYARVPTRLLTRWLYGSAQGGAVVRPERGAQDAEHNVSFLDLVQALAIRVARLQYHVSLHKIRQAVDKAEQNYSLSHPFARPHVTYLYGSELVIKLGEDIYVQASGKHMGNLMIKPIVEFYMKQLTFSHDGFANLYRPFEWHNCRVALNPQVRFGEPLIESCGYSAYALWQSVKAEGSIETAANVCGVTATEVETAYRYYDQILGRVAA
jgi:uncharacterized protein (DUF433 family)